jgi:hypothetical protein
MPDESTAFLAFPAFPAFLALDRPYAPRPMLFALNKKAGPKPRGRSPTDHYRPHQQDSLSLPVTYLRKEAVANACSP